MARIRGKDTKPELLLRRALHARGLRYRLHDRNLPGRPDLVFPGRKAVIFVHGCFWHGHGCSLFKVPRTNAVFWEAKIGRNRHHDRRASEGLKERGWRIMTLWECAFRGRARMDRVALIEQVERWLSGGDAYLELGELAAREAEVSDCF